jgi:hypothetical protein
MPLNNAGKGVALNALGAAVLRVSLHTADPSTSGANEVTGGSPAYAKEAVAFGAATNGVIASTGDVVFDVPGGTTITHLGFWNAAGTTFYGGQALSAPETYGSQGTYTLLTGDITVTLT